MSTGTAHARRTSGGGRPIVLPHARSRDTPAATALRVMSVVGSAVGSIINSTAGVDDEAQSPLQPRPPAASLPPALVRRLLCKLVPLLWLGYYLQIQDRTNFGFAELTMGPDLGLTPRAFGIASGVFFVAYALFQVPSNQLVLTVGATRVLACGMVCWGVLSAATSLVRTPLQLCALRFGLGLAESGYYPAALLYFTHWFPDVAAGQALAFYSTAASVGSLGASAGSAVLMGLMDGVHGVPGWRWLLALQGLPAVVVGFVIYRVLPERPRDAAWLAPAERELLRAALAADAAHVAPPLRVTLGRTLLLPRTWRFALQYVAVSAMMNSSRFFLPTLVREVYPKMAPWRVGLAFLLPATLKVLAAPVSARWADRGGDSRRERVAWGLFGLASCLLLLSSLGMATSGASQPGKPFATLLIALVALADCATQVAIPTFWSLHHSGVPRSLAGCSIAVVNSVGNLGGFVGPSVLGALHDAAAAARPAAARGVTACWSQGVAALGVSFALVTAVSAAAAPRAQKQWGL